MASPSLESLLATLATSDVEFIVVGMLAAVAQGAPVTTHDLDIVHRRTPENVARLLDLLVNKLDARYRGRTDILRPAVEILAGIEHSLLKTNLGPLELKRGSTRLKDQLALPILEETLKQSGE
jgi:hypothetical protein